MEFEGDKEGNEEGPGERGDEQDGNERRSSRQRTPVARLSPSPEGKEKNKKSAAMHSSQNLRNTKPSSRTEFMTGDDRCENQQFEMRRWNDGSRSPLDHS